MEEEEVLKRFYYEVMVPADTDYGYPPFEALDAEFKKKMAGTISFGGFRLGLAFEEFKNAVKEDAKALWAKLN